MRQEIAEGQRGRDDLSFLLEVQVVQAIAPLRPRHDGHRLGGVVMVMVVMVLLVEVVLRGQIVALLVAGLVGALTRHQVDAADAYGHRRRGILETAALLPPPGAEDRDQARQGSYRVPAS